MREKTPQWFKFYPAAVSGEVQGMGLKEQGAYFVLMNAIWARGPISESEVIRLCRGCHEEILPVMVDVDGSKSFAWLEEAIAASAAAMQKAAEAGRASAAARSTNVQRKKNARSTPVQRPFNARSADVERSLSGSSTPVEQSLNACSTDVLSNLISSNHISSSSSLGGGEGGTDPQAVEAEVWPTFSDFWDAYEKKRDRPLCEAEWAKLSQKDREAVMQAIPAYIASTPDKTYRKDPIRFLKRKSWEDEIVSTTAGNKAGGGPDPKGASLHDLIARKYASAGGDDTAGY